MKLTVQLLLVNSASNSALSHACVDLCIIKTCILVSDFSGMWTTKHVISVVVQV